MHPARQGTGRRPMHFGPRGETEIDVGRTGWMSDHRHGHCIETARTRLRSNTGSGLVDVTSPGQPHRMISSSQPNTRSGLRPFDVTNNDAPSMSETNKLVEEKVLKKTSRSHHCCPQDGDDDVCIHCKLLVDTKGCKRETRCRTTR